MSAVRPLLDSAFSRYVPECDHRTECPCSCTCGANPGNPVLTIAHTLPRSPYVDLRPPGVKRTSPRRYCDSTNRRSGSHSLQWVAKKIRPYVGSWHGICQMAARHLKRAVEKNLVFPLANLVASAQVRMGDFLRVDRSPDGQMVFVKEAEGATESILTRSGGWAAGLPSSAAQSAATTSTPRLLHLPT